MAAVEERWVLRLEKAISAIDEDLVTQLLSEPGAKNGILMTNGPDRRFPLYWAVESGSLSILCQLLQKDVRVRQRSAMGWTALHCAADGNRVDMVPELLGSPDADVNEQTNTLETPLHLAARRGHAAVVRLLLASGANSQATTASGETALELAKRTGHQSVQSLLGDETLPASTPIPAPPASGSLGQNHRGLYRGFIPGTSASEETSSQGPPASNSTNSHSSDSPGTSEDPLPSGYVP
jgi:ankyrin repeat protein